MFVRDILPPLEITIIFFAEPKVMLAIAAAADPHDKVSPAPASLVLDTIAPPVFFHKEIFASLKNFRFLSFLQWSERS